MNREFIDLRNFRACQENIEFQGASYTNIKYGMESTIVLPVMTNIMLKNKESLYKDLFSKLSFQEPKSCLLAQLAEKERQLPKEAKSGWILLDEDVGNGWKFSKFPTNISKKKGKQDWGNAYEYYYSCNNGQKLHAMALKDPYFFPAIGKVMNGQEIALKEVEWTMGYSEPIFDRAIEAIIKGDPIWTNKKLLRVGLNIANGTHRIEVLASQLKSSNRLLFKEKFTDIRIGSDKGDFSIILANKESVYYPNHLRNIKEVNTTMIVKMYENSMYDISKITEHYASDLVLVYQMLSLAISETVIFFNLLDPTKENPKRNISSWWRNIILPTKSS